MGLAGEIEARDGSRCFCIDLRLATKISPAIPIGPRVAAKRHRLRCRGFLAMKQHFFLADS